MRDAAVGFQCPSCVSEGAKSTRSGRTPYGGKRSANPARTSQVLIGINVAVWLLIASTGGRVSEWVTRLALLPTGRCELTDGSGSYLPSATEAQCAVTPAQLHWVSGVADGAPWQLVTSVFTHVDLWHIGFNMLALFILGPQLELFVGRARFLTIYLLSGLSGSALVYWLSSPQQATLGASGAIFGLMGALLVIAFKAKANTSQLLTWIGLNFLITVVGRGFISWQGHLGGFLGGIALAAIVAYAPRDRRTHWQVLGFLAVAVLLAVAIVGRTALLSV